ncbi:MAG TPA: hypothetical protein V6D10_07345 [Trichocoleus sp.]|jgi:hypothetical protein
MQQSVRQYKNWLILISQVQREWGFVVCAKEGEPLTDHHEYETAAQASIAAESFIDCVMGCSELRGLLDEWFEAGSISADQYGQAECLIVTIARAQILHRSTVVQALTQPPPEIPPD